MDDFELDDRVQSPFADQGFSLSYKNENLIDISICESLLCSHFSLFMTWVLLLVYIPVCVCLYIFVYYPRCYIIKLLLFN